MILPSKSPKFLRFRPPAFSATFTLKVNSSTIAGKKDSSGNGWKTRRFSAEMNRRPLRWRLLPLIAGALMSVPAPCAADPLAAGFAAPPVDARPMTWMHWMNGNITQAGMTRDMEALADAGVGGVLIFSVSRGMPEGKVRFNSDEYRAIAAHSVKEADRLGLTIGFHNCDGWSSSGGPWVTVEDSMKRVVASEVIVEGGAVATTLPQPATVQNFYRDIALIAVPATTDERTMAGEVPILTESKGKVQLAYAKPYRAQSFIVEHRARGMKVTLLSSADGVTFTKVASSASKRTGKSVWVCEQSFAPVTARFFRLDFEGGPPSRKVKLAADPRLPDWLGRAGMESVADREMPVPTAVLASAFTPVDQVRVITDKPGAGGRLTTTLPRGTWRILRIGYTTTGAINQPATAAGEGLECDKFSRAALDRHFAAYLGKIIAESGSLVGKTLRFSEIDSYEMGGQNWTEGLPELFKAAKGYDLTPFLPLLVGRCIGDPEIATAVLRDFRDCICTLMVENYYRRFTELCHQYGMRSYIEPYGNGPLNELTVGGTADIPMGEFWLNGPSILKSAISAAHTYGKPVISAESFTSRNDPNWKAHPFLLKEAGDRAWASGINEFMFHRYAHQANTHVAPGMTMMNVGTHLDGTQTWWRNAGKAWMQYLQRGNFLLRQGVPVADVLVYAGEAMPQEVPKSIDLPAGYQFDVCDTEVLLHRLSVHDGRLVLPEGTSYRVLALRNAERLSVKTLKRLQELAEAGACIAGPRPTAPLGFLEWQTQRAAFTALAKTLWGDGKAPVQRVGKGRIYGKLDWPVIFQDLALAPDLLVNPGKGGKDAEAAPFTHRAIGNADVYFLLNQYEKKHATRASFRVADRVPEIWHADTGRIESLANYTQTKGRTEIELPLPLHESAFVVFREPAQGRDPIAKVEKDGAALEVDRYRLLHQGTQDVALLASANGSYRLTHASGRTSEVRITDVKPRLTITGAWQVSFAEKWGGPTAITFPKLTDWKDHADEGIRYYSGTAIYRKTVTIPADQLGGAPRLWLDLGQVAIAAVVVVNGREVGTLWKPPFTIEVTEALKAGDNALEIRVTNTWANRLIGDAKIPRTDGFSLKGKMVDWYALNQPPPPSPRRTFTTYDFYEKDRRLQPSGLLGPVALVSEVRATVPR
jgi:hypothetical protein